MEVILHVLQWNNFTVTWYVTENPTATPLRWKDGVSFVELMAEDYISHECLEILWQGVSYDAAAEGYYHPLNFTIMQALYYLSSLAESANDLPETSLLNGVPGQVNLPYAGHSTVSAPTIQQPQPPALGDHDDFGYDYIGQGNYQGGFYGVQVLGDYDRAEYSQYHDGVITHACNSNHRR